MAWEATYLLSPIVLVLLAPGSWAEDTDVRRAVEGRTVSVDCPYAPGQRFKKKVWCQEISAEICQILVSSPSLVAQQPKYSMRDHPESHFFTVTMTAVTRRDSGFYFCGITGNGRRISILRTIRLVVSEASTPHMTTWMTTALTSATSPTMESPPDSWTWKVTTAGVAVAILLLLCLVALVLYFRNVRGRAKGVENEGPHIYEDFSGQKKETTGINQQTLSNKDTDTICYASLLHLNHVSHQDSISSGTQPCPKPSPDPLRSVEYAILSRSTLRSSKAAAVEVKTSN